MRRCKRKKKKQKKEEMLKNIIRDDVVRYEK